MLTLICLGALFILSTIAQTVGLWLGARWANLAGVSLRRCFMALLALTMLALLAQPVLASDAVMHYWPIINIAGFVLALAVVSRYIIGARGFQLVKLWLAFAASVALCLALAFLIVRPYVLDGFIAPTNSMAPTLVGPHYYGRCPRCGGKLIFGSQNAESSDESWVGICESCKRTATVPIAGADVGPPDRACIDKLVTPRRWDIVAFHTAKDRSQFWVKRLVGLPGEEVVIKDGGVWIDGGRLEPPSELRELNFAAKCREECTGFMWGSPDHPARLGRGEYFVLGDFAPFSTDSRTWTEGAPDHPPYAVPARNVIGVVSVTYWPFR